MSAQIANRAATPDMCCSAPDTRHAKIQMFYRNKVSAKIILCAKIVTKMNARQNSIELILKQVCIYKGTLVTSYQKKGKEDG